jgi:D-arabinono-1,4-lactone oxidase
LYLNATLYRPYLCDPPCKERYYQAFEWLMRDLGGRPHWAKNFGAKEGIDREAILEMYGNDMNEWVRLQKQVDPKGMFVGDWQRRWIFGRNDDGSDTEKSESPDDENSVYQTWGSVVQVKQVRKLQSETSEDSFDVMHEGDAAESMVILGGEEGGNGKYPF